MKALGSGLVALLLVCGAVALAQDAEVDQGGAATFSSARTTGNLTVDGTLVVDGGTITNNNVTVNGQMRSNTEVVNGLITTDGGVLINGAAASLDSTAGNITTGFMRAELVTGAAAGETVNFRGFFRPTMPVKIRQVSCQWTTAGTGGTTGVVVKIRNITDSTDLCSCTVAACTMASTSVSSCDCNSASTTALKTYSVQLAATTDCAGNPVDVYCTAEIAR